jgi:G6PDH family F420-dependent oxidoreductase
MPPASRASGRSRRPAKPVLGYSLSSEEHAPDALVAHAVAAEAAGFAFALISDHYHPWTTPHGQSPFVWAVLGAIAARTERLRVGTGVTCPLVRIHPAIIAQAAATTAALFGDRFFLGLGTGENLNEHILGDRWPRSGVRLDMMSEAIDILRRLFTGEEVTFDGEYYTVDEARLFSRPKKPPPIYLSATGPQAAELAAAEADGMIGVSPEKSLIDGFRRKARRKPVYGQVTVCWGKTEQAARRVAYEWWPQAGLQGDLSWEVKTPELFEAACKTLTPEQATEHIPCGPDPAPYLRAIRQYAAAGYDHIYLHQVGPDQHGFFTFYRKEIAPHF